MIKKLIGLIIGKIVLTAQLLPINQNGPLKYLWGYLFYTKRQREQLQSLYPNFIKENTCRNIDKLNVNRFKVASSNNAVLDTVEMCLPANQKHKKYVIYGWGRSDCFEINLKRLATEALNLQAHVISFNYRGVGYSSGQPYSEEDLAQDYYHQVKRLIEEQNIDPKDIYCYGHSLGGAIGILAVDRLHQEGLRNMIYNDRSFNNLVNVSVGVNFEKTRPREMIVKIGTFFLLAPMLAALFVFSPLSALQWGLIAASCYLSFKINFTYKVWDSVIGNTLNSWMQGLMQYSGWVMDVAAKFDRIPNEYKSYMLIKGPSKDESKLGLGVKHFKGEQGDKVIHHKHSLHAHLDSYASLKSRLKQTLSAASGASKPDAEVDEIKCELLEHANVKVTGGSHMDWPQQFITRYAHPKAKRTLTGQERLYHFIEPEGQHISPNPRQYKSF